MRAALDSYDDLPRSMRRYLRYNGWHFNKPLCDYAISLMRKNGKPLEAISKEKDRAFGLKRLALIDKESAALKKQIGRN